MLNASPTIESFDCLLLPGPCWACRQEPPLGLDVTQTCDELGPVTVGLEQDY